MPALACDACFCYACDAVRTGKVEPLPTLPVGVALLLQYQRVVSIIIYMPVKTQVMIAGNVQLVCGYIETSLYLLIKSRDWTNTPQDMTV